MEMIIRKSIVETFNEYLSTSSIGGIKQIRDPTNRRIQRIFWIIIFCAALSMVCYFLHSTWMTTFTRPLIVTAESTTYPISLMDFPAVSLCNFNRISKKTMMIHANSAFQKYGYKNLTFFIEIFRSMGRLIDYRYEERIQRTVDWISNHLPVDVVNFMSKLTPQCDEMLIKCKWAGQEVNCTDIFQTRRTGLGYCCSFNYVLQLNSINNPNEIIQPAKRQEVAGAHNGLMVVVDPMIDDYAYRLGVRDGFQVLLHDTRQFPDMGSGRVLYRMAQPDSAQFLQIESVKQYATAEVHKYPHQTRLCLFHNELKTKYGNMYSSSACLVRCRMETVRSLCKCVPFYYPIHEISKDYRVCDFRHLRCLNKYKEKLLYLYPFEAKDTAGLETELADSLYCEDCLPDCELTQHFTRSYKVSLAKLSRSGFESNFLVDVNVTNKCVLNIYHPTSVGRLHRLDVVSYWFEILSNIGGFAGMMMGIGFYTFVEMIYYIMIRLVRSIYINYKKYRSI